MVCGECNQENKGIKLNGKLYCTNCGALLESAAEILEDAYAHSPAPKDITEAEKQKIKKDLMPKAERRLDTNELEAEEEVLDLIIKKNKNVVPKGTKFDKQTIEKRNRQRTTHPKGEREKHSIYHLVAGEPDPTAEPEIEAPHDDLIAEAEPTKPKVGVELTKDKETRFPLQTNEEREEIERKKKVKKEALGAYFKSSGAAAVKKPAPKKRTKWSSRKKVIVSSVLIVSALLIGFAGLVYYVNVYALNSAYVQKKIESKPDFSYQKPSYMLPSYQLSYLSKSGSDYIIYHYANQAEGKGNEYIEISIKKSDVTTDNFVEKIVTPSGQTYTTKTTNDGTEMWLLGTGKITFAKNGLLYEISSSAIISSEELIKIAEGLL